MIRIGVDVGGTNTDAVILNGTSFVAGAKSPTTPDILSGVSKAIRAAFEGAPVGFDQVDAIMVGTTHFVNAIVQRKSLATTGWCGCACRREPVSCPMPTGLMR